MPPIRLNRGTMLKHTSQTPAKRLIQLAILLVACLVLVQPAYAEKNRKAKVEESTKAKRKYVHPCAPGTEQVGSGPPDGLTAYCRQPVVGGYRKQGIETDWYSNGQKRFEGEYVRDKKHGVWTTFHRNGEKKAVETFYNGKRTNKAKYDRKGQPVKEEDKDAQRRENRQKFKWRNDMKY